MVIDVNTIEFPSICLSHPHILSLLACFVVLSLWGVSLSVCSVCVCVCVHVNVCFLCVCFLVWGMCVFVWVYVCMYVYVGECAVYVCMCVCLHMCEEVGVRWVLVCDGAEARLELSMESQRS